MKNPIIGFVGGGNMATAIIRGLVTRGVEGERLAVSDPSPERRQALAALLGADTGIGASNEAVADEADVLVLAVKPQVLPTVLAPLTPVIQRRRPLVVSIAAGMRAEDIDRRLGGGLPVVRCMPNQPALVGEGMTVLFANEAAQGQRDSADEILSAVGPTLWVEDETMIDAATAISGSGPAYFFYLMELLIEAATDFGFSAAEARQLGVQTARGASAVAEAEDEEPSVLRERVTSPGGTTAAAFDVLEEADVRAIFRRAFEAARRRAGELADDAAAD
ncbi:MAG: pyrroline-5-carboxylate reductase [Gammaproteobacteria bacterium]